MKEPAGVTRTGASRRSTLEATHKRLTDAIAEQEWETGEKLPSEVELAALFGVSRPILREVLRELELAGQIVRRHGAGTFVATPPRIETRLPTIVSLELAAMSLSTRVEEVERSIERVTVTSGAPSPLGLEPGESTWQIRRVKTVAGRRALSMVDHIPGDLVPADRIGSELAASLLEVVLTYAGTPTVTVTDDLIAELADEEAIERLHVPPGTLLTTVLKTVRRPDGKVLQFGRAQYVASLFRFTVESEVTKTQPHSSRTRTGE
jgi:GntR family transcriptional regulator